MPRVKRADRYENYGNYIHKVLKSVHPGTPITNAAMAIMNDFVKDIFRRIATEAGHLARYNKRQTITAREIQSACRLVIPGELGKKSVEHGTMAITLYGETTASYLDKRGKRNRKDA
jgi:histone H3/H4